MAAAEDYSNPEFTQNWDADKTGVEADPVNGVDCSETKKIFKAFKTRRSFEGQPARQWLVAYPRETEKYFFHDLGPVVTDEMSDEVALRQVVARMQLLGQGMNSPDEELEDSTHKFKSGMLRKKGKRKPCLGYVHWRANNQFLCIDYCRDEFPAQLKFIHPQGGKEFKEFYQSSSGVNDQHFKFNDESSLNADDIIEEVNKIQNN